MKQISVFLENKTGQLSEFVHTLSDHQVNMRALSLADTTDFGILRMIVDETDRTAALLTDEGYAFSVTDVVAVRAADKPGALTEALKACADNEICVEYAYAFLTSTPNTACLIVRTDDYEKSVSVLEAHGIATCAEDEI